MNLSSLPDEQFASMLKYAETKSLIKMRKISARVDKVTKKYRVNRMELKGIRLVGKSIEVNFDFKIGSNILKGTRRIGKDVTLWQLLQYFKTSSNHSQKGTMDICTLPLEMLASVMKYLPESSFKQLRKTCNRLDLATRSYRDTKRISYLRAMELFEMENYTEMYSLLENQIFSRKNHSTLQAMWWKARYHDAEKFLGRPLDAVEKLQKRKDHPLPNTIDDDILIFQNGTYCEQSSSRQRLRLSYAEQQYPNPGQKKKIAKEIGIPMMQLTHFFKNKRQRDRAEGLMAR